MRGDGEQNQHSSDAFHPKPNAAPSSNIGSNFFVRTVYISLTSMWPPTRVTPFPSLRPTATFWQRENYNNPMMMRGEKDL
mmetsp:Transcript_2149/g.2476  ORF Transcript_2149/g.2476 Transcript_2149/m.2476 type:complete len:80 (-) Transcript_2149:13-252(-)